MRPRLLLAVAAVPLVAAAAVIAQGCGSDEPPIDDICGWLSDPENCYRTFYEEVRTRCGADFDPAADVRTSQPLGSFIERSALDICILQGGGQVVFDPAPMLENFPLTSIGVKRLDARSEECGAMSFTNNYNMSVTVEPCTEVPEDDAPVCNDALDGSGSASGYGKNTEAVVGGTFAVASEEGRDIYNATCPSGESFRFNRFEATKCDGYETLQPRAEIESDPGGTIPPWEPDTIPYEGFIRFRVYYPPYDGELKDADSKPIQYFNCIIPPQDPCDDGLKNFFETDVDCGGPSVGDAAPNLPGETVQRSCDRCATGQICETTADCEMGTCVEDGVTGFNKCKE